MIRHYFKIFFRNLKRHPLYSAINFGSLVLGMAFSLVLVIITYNAFPDDRFHENYGDIHHVVGYSGESQVNLFPRSLHDYLEEQFPAVQTAFSYRSWSEDVRVGEKVFSEEILMASPGFFQTMSFDLETGDSETALEQPNVAYLTAEKARILFGRADPLGETVEIQIDGIFRELLIGGIVESYPRQSTVDPDIVVSAQLPKHLGICPDPTNTLCHNALYLLLPEDRSEAFLERLNSALPEINSRSGLISENAIEQIRLVNPLHEPDYSHPPFYIAIFLALLILALSCFNYVNNTIAATSVRFREIGIRKVLGSDRRRIASQFLAESFLTVLAAVGLMLLLLVLTMPLLHSYISYLSEGHMQLTTADLFSGNALMILSAILILATLLSGAWPALVISRFQPTVILKNRNTIGGAPLLSKILVGFQLTFTVIILILVFNAGNSLSAMDEDYFGYRSEGIIRVPVLEPAAEEGVKNIYSIFRDRLAGEGYHLPMAAMKSGGSPEGYGEVAIDDRRHVIRTAEVTPSFFGLMNISFSEAEPLTRKSVTADSTAVVINSTLKEQLGWERATGNTLSLDGRPVSVAGVLDTFQNFNGEGTRTPFAFILIPESASGYALIDAGAATVPLSRAMEDIRSIRMGLWNWEREYLHVGEVNFTRQERNLAYMVELLSLVTTFVIALSALGLFSLTSFSVSRRLKEISIRKVSGASPTELMRLLLKDYLVLGAVAFAVALPAGYALSNLLVGLFTSASGSFLGLFLMTLVSLTLFILICVGYQVHFAANENPVKYLKEE